MAGLREAVVAGLLVLVPAAAAPLAGQDVAGGSADRRAVIGVATGLFDAMRSRDAGALRALFHPSARLVTVARDEEGRTVARASTVDDFARAVGGEGPYLDETIRDPEVRIDGDLAQLWTYYELRVDEAFSHCGVDAFQMVRTDDGWRIVHLADTRRREGCGREG